MPTLTFPKTDLKRVQNGEKTTTRRVSHLLHRTRPGAELTMQFGARNAPTTLRTTVQQVEVLDFLAYRDEIVSSGDPRGTLEGAAFDAEIERSGTDHEKRLLTVAREYGLTMTGLVEELDDKTAAAVEHAAERQNLNPAKLTDAQVDDLFSKYRQRVVIVTFQTPA